MKAHFAFFFLLYFLLPGRLFAQSYPVDACLGGSSNESLVATFEFEAYGTQYFAPFLKADSVWRYYLLNSTSADGFYTGRDTDNFEAAGDGTWLVRVNLNDHRIEKIFAGNSTLVNYEKGFLFFDILDDRYARTVLIDDSFRLKNIALLDSFELCNPGWDTICTELSSANAMAEGDSLIHLYVKAPEYVPGNPAWLRVFRYTLTSDGVYRGKEQSPTYFLYNGAGVYGEKYWHISNNSLFFYDNRDSLVKTLEAEPVPGTFDDGSLVQGDTLYWFRLPATIPRGLPMDIYRTDLDDLGHTHSRLYARQTDTYMGLLSGWTQYLSAGLIAVGEGDSAYFYRLGPAGEPQLVYSRRLGLNLYGFTGAVPYQDSLHIFMFRGAENSFFQLCSSYGKVLWTASLPQFLTAAPGLLKNPRSERFTRTRNLKRYYAIASYSNEQGQLDVYSALFRFNPANRQSTVVALGKPGERFLDVFDDALGNVYLLASRPEGECFPGTVDLVLYKLTGVPTGVAQLHTDREIKIYPNPAQDKLIIDLQKLNGQKTELMLFDLSGKLLFFRIVLDPQTTIDISSLPSGSYVLQAGSDTDLACRKFIVIRQ